MADENPVKEEGELQKAGGEWLDLNELAGLLCELDAVATQVDNLAL